jgi:hypothetical protein
LDARITPGTLDGMEEESQTRTKEESEEGGFVEDRKPAAKPKVTDDATTTMSGVDGVKKLEEAKGLKLLPLDARITPGTVDAMEEATQKQ